MATTETANQPNRNAVAVYVLAGLVVVAVVAGLVASFDRPSQIGTSEEVFRTVDALYTAVRNRDEKQLAECEQRLAGYRDAGKLPTDAADQLDKIIAKARTGSWETAAERLYDFMRAQKREASTPHPSKPSRKATK